MVSCEEHRQAGLSTVRPAGPNRTTGFPEGCTALLGPCGILLETYKGIFQDMLTVNRLYYPQASRVGINRPDPPSSEGINRGVHYRARPQALRPPISARSQSRVRADIKDEPPWRAASRKHR